MPDRNETELDRLEYGVRFVVPHKNAGEACWMPDVQMAAYMVVETPGMSELVERQVGPWRPVMKAHGEPISRLSGGES